VRNLPIASTTMPPELAMRRAVSARDASFDGAFVYGVVTTGVYCRPSCASRPAKPATCDLSKSGCGGGTGLRACKRCRPALPMIGHRADTGSRAIYRGARGRATLSQDAVRARPSFADPPTKSFQECYWRFAEDVPRCQSVPSTERRAKDGQRRVGLHCGGGLPVYEPGLRKRHAESWHDPLTYRDGGAERRSPTPVRDTALGALVMAATTEVAQGIGAPKAVRAAASACAANKIAVLIPCHRVLRGDGGLAAIDGY